MNPYIICHMLSSVNGKIDGNALDVVIAEGEYDATGSKLEGDAWICGRTTMQQHFAEDELFVSASNTPAGPQPFGFLSSRYPIKTGWRNRSSRVHSVNFTSEMMIGLTQTHRFISAAVNPGSRPRPVAGRLTNGQSLTAVLLSSAESNFRSFFAESGADSASKLEVPRFIDADQQGAHVSPFPGRLGISADHHRTRRRPEIFRRVARGLLRRQEAQICRQGRHRFQ
jgi:hypothetical protein